MPYTVNMVCSICGRTYLKKEIERDPKGLVTHGYCKICGPKWHAEQMAEVFGTKEGGDSNV